MNCLNQVSTIIHMDYLWLIWIVDPFNKKYTKKNQINIIKENFEFK